MNAGSQEEAFSPIVGRARARLTTGVVLMTLALIGATLTVGASPAQAKTYKRLATKSVKAYDSAGYKYRIKASGFGRVPSGYINVANSVTVKRNGRTVAKNKASYRAKAGTYSVYYKSKIRKKTAYEYTRVVNYRGRASECLVTGVTVNSMPPTNSYGDYDVSYTGQCNGLYYTGDVIENGWISTGTYYRGTYVGTWSVTASPCRFSDPSSYISLCPTTSAIGDTFTFSCSYGSVVGTECVSDDGPSGLIPVDVATTGYRYGPVLTRYFKRTVKVVKKNSRFITPSEWKKLRSGLSVGEVSRLFGNAGKVSYVSGNLVSRAYRDIRWDGSYCNTYYLTFKNGKLYSWDNDQFTDTCVSY